MASTSLKSIPVLVCIDTKRRTVGEMVRGVEHVSKTWVNLKLSGSDFKPLHEQFSEQRWYWTYSPACYAWLQAVRWAELREYPLLGDYTPLRQLSLEIGHSVRWIHATIRRHRLRRPTIRRNKFNWPTPCLSPTTTKSIRTLAKGYAPPGWHCSQQLSELTGWTRRTILRRLNGPKAIAAGITQDEYLADNGHPTVFYSPGAKAYLGEKPQDYPPAGDAMTIGRIAEELGRDRSWVKSRLKRRHHLAAGKPMLDDRSRPRIHYQHWVFEELEAESNRLIELQRAREAAFAALPDDERQRLARQREMRCERYRRLRRRQAEKKRLAATTPSAA